MRALFFDFASAAEARGLVVVVDVLRASTSAVMALAAGAREVIVAPEPAAARRLKAGDPDLLLVGEIAGVKPPDFDVGNSPAAFGPEHRGRRIVLSSGAGAPALCRAPLSPGPVLCAAFVNAASTARAIRACGQDTVSFVVTGTHAGWDGDEDRACAEYVLALAQGRRPDPTPFLDRVRASQPGRNLGDPKHPEFAPADLACALGVDAVDLVARARDLGGRRAVVAG